MPFVAACMADNFATSWHTATIVDKRGDVYELTKRAPVRDMSPYETAGLVRRTGEYKGTLPPADVDRLVALIPALEREPLVKHQRNAADLPSGDCTLFRPGPSPESVVGVFAHSWGQTGSSRKGRASVEVDRVLEAAQRLPATADH